MIIHLPSTLSPEQVAQTALTWDATWLKTSDYYILVTDHTMQQLPESLQGVALNYWAMPTDSQLTSRTYHPQTHSVKIGDAILGGEGRNQVMIAGPCAVESREQIQAAARMLVKTGVKVMRAGCFKPRTSPYTFRGLGEKGLELLDEVREQYGLTIVTEACDSSHVEQVIQHTDVVQIGAKSMYDQQLLMAAAKGGKPILLKRGFGTTLQEAVNAAELIMSCGNNQVVLCERGIRTFETATRFTLDLCGVAWLKEHVNVPIILDPSHAMGFAYGVGDLARACTAMGVDGLLIETHPNPEQARSDAAQQLNEEQFVELYESIKPIAQAIGKKLI